jgi:hypothetical protein
MHRSFDCKTSKSHISRFFLKLLSQGQGHQMMPRIPFQRFWALLFVLTNLSFRAWGGQVTHESFSMLPAHRIAGSTNAAATFSFRPAADLETGGHITLHYPSGFFDVSVTPTAAVSPGSQTLTADQPGNTFLVIAMTGDTFDTMTTITIILSGLKVGNVVKLSSDVTITTDNDTSPSQTMSFGDILAHSVEFDPALSAAALIAGAPQSFTRAPSPTPSGGPRFSSPHTAHKKRYICFCTPLPSFLV